MAKQEETATRGEEAIVTLSLTAVVLVLAAAAWMFLMPSETPDFAAHIYWYLGRSGGMVAYWLLFGSVALGIAVSSRVFDGMLARPWVFEVHKFLSIFVLLAMLFHVLILLPDPWAKFTVVEMFVPFKSHYRPTPVALGTIAFYGSLIVTGSFYLKRFIGGQKGWRWLHYATFALFIMALLHGLLSGTDSERPAVQYSYLSSGVAVLFLVFFRILATRAYGGKPRAEKPAVPRPAAKPAAPAAPQPVVAQAQATSPTPPPQPAAAVTPRPVVDQAVSDPAARLDTVVPPAAAESGPPAATAVAPSVAITQPMAQPETPAEAVAQAVPEPDAAESQAPGPVDPAPAPAAREETAVEPPPPPEATGQAPAPHPSPPHAAPVEHREPAVGYSLN